MRKGNSPFPEIMGLLQNNRDDWKDITWAIECQSLEDVRVSIDVIQNLKDKREI